MQSGSIYIIENVVNGKKYVGQTSRSVEQRFHEHLMNARAGALGIHGAIAKHGCDSFMISLAETNISHDQLDDRERFWIAQLGTFGAGYNLTTGGEGSYIRTPESRQYTSLCTKNAMNDPIVRWKCGSSTRGKKQKTETIAKRSVSLQGQRNGNWGKFGAEHPCSGPMSDEHKKKISDAKRGIKFDAKVRHNMSVAHKIPVLRLDVDGNVTKRYDSAHDAVVDGFSAQQVNRASRGVTKNNMHAGYVWVKEVDFVVTNQIGSAGA